MQTSSSELAAVPLFAGLPEEALRELGQVLERRELPSGAVLWRQGDEADGLFVVSSGSVGVFARLPGGREVELAVQRAGEIVGELALVDGGVRAATVRALEPASALFLRRADFLARIARLDPVAFTIKQRLTSIICKRLRDRLSALAASIGGDEAQRGEAMQAKEADAVPDARYLIRLPFFRTFPPLQLSDLFTATRTVKAPAGTVLLHEGDRAEIAYVTLHGAVEEVLERGSRRIRVRLAGPGGAAGYIGLLDDGPSPVTVATRERTLLLAVDRPAFTDLSDGSTALSFAFVDAVQRDLIVALRQAERPQARLAAPLPRA